METIRREMLEFPCGKTEAFKDGSVIYNLNELFTSGRLNVPISCNAAEINALDMLINSIDKDLVIRLGVIVSDATYAFVDIRPCVSIAAQTKYEKNIILEFPARPTTYTLLIDVNSTRHEIKSEISHIGLFKKTLKFIHDNDGYSVVTRQAIPKIAPAAIVQKPVAPAAITPATTVAAVVAVPKVNTSTSSINYKSYFKYVVDSENRVSISMTAYFNDAKTSFKVPLIREAALNGGCACDLPFCLKGHPWFTRMSSFLAQYHTEFKAVIAKFKDTCRQFHKSNLSAEQKNNQSKQILFNVAKALIDVSLKCDQAEFEFVANN
jgi:hypothetical protein